MAAVNLSTAEIGTTYSAFGYAPMNPGTTVNVCSAGKTRLSSLKRFDTLLCPVSCTIVK